MSSRNATQKSGVAVRRGSFRPEIEGLRALAIGLVLLFHAGVPILHGGFVGVDVFFVISGFLITSHIVREIETRGRLDLVSFWGRRMKRLLPAALTVFVVTALAAWFVVPNTSWRSIGADIAAASLYIVNWRFAAEAVDYNAEGAGVSPLLHFWSLAVEEQFYVIWPILLALGAWLVLRGRGTGRVRTLTGAVLALVAIPSFVWSVHYTQVNPDGAFFVTTTRLWELGAGAAVAVGAAWWPLLPRAVAVLLGWGGAAAIGFAALAFSKATPWPGTAALVPVLGTAAIIIATTGRDLRWIDAGRFFALGPLVWMGSLSYSWYLWHWPVLVLAEAQWGELRLRYRLLLVLFSGVLAWLSLKFIENPIRRSKRLAGSPGLTVSFGLNLSFVGVLAGLVLILLVPSSTGAGSATGSPASGAGALRTGADGVVLPYEPAETAAGVVPSPADATADLPQAQHDGCVVSDDETEVVVCEYGDPEGDLQVALVGDSKILQWQPAISQIAERRGWRISTYFKSACAFAEPLYDLGDRQRANCAEWNRSALARLKQDAPDVVVTTGRKVFDGVDSGGDVDPGAEMIAAWWSELREAGIRVVPLLDNPAPDFEVYECVAEHPEELSQCSFDRDEAIERSGAGFQLAAAELLGVETTVDTADLACPAAERCPAVIGDVLVYRQGSHLTDTFIESTVDLLEARLSPAVEAAGG
ncbi:acyltransferase family protein [Leucobacter sp.]